MNTTLIKRAIIHEIDEIMNFIDKEWKKNHILSKNKELFEYDFREEELLNFIIAKSPNNQILGLIGYIKSNTSNHPDIWASIWKVSSLNKYPLLGLYLLNYLRKKIHYRHFIVSGISKNTIDIYKGLGIQTGILKQAYILNPCKKKFEIAKINNSKIRGERESHLSKTNYYIEEIKDYEILESYLNSINLKSCIPYKDFNYFQKRFLQHPIFIYQYYGIFSNKCISALIVCRVVTYCDSKCIRIVDYYGKHDKIVFAKPYLLNLLIEYNYEYIDFLQYGFNNDILLSAGFRFLDYEKDDIIIPNYFAPFIRKNRAINFAADLDQSESFTIFKADGDQDRPNLIL